MTHTSPPPDETPVHDMELLYEHNGVQEWACPKCVRRFFVIVQPYTRIVVEDGDTFTVHSMAKEEGS